MFYKEFYKRELEFKVTTNSRVYKISRSIYYRKAFKRKNLRCWKYSRNTQYKIVEKVSEIH